MILHWLNLFFYNWQNVKFLELRKCLLASSPEEFNAINCIDFDNESLTVYLAQDKQLFVVQLANILDFTWNKSIINEIVTDLNHIRITLSLRAQFVSVSAKGFGSKLAVAGLFNTTTSMIHFYDLNSISKSKQEVIIM